MKKCIIILIALLWVLSAQAQFSDDIQIVASGAAHKDSLLVDSLSQVYRLKKAWDNLTIYYAFIDTTSGYGESTSGSTMYFEAILKGKLKNNQYIMIDSTVVDSATVVTENGMTWTAWSISDSTNWAFERFRLRKSTAVDSLIAILKGTDE